MLSKDFIKGIVDVLEVKALECSKRIIGEVRQDFWWDVWISRYELNGKFFWEELLDALVLGVVFRIKIDFIASTNHRESNFAGSAMRPKFVGPRGVILDTDSNFAVAKLLIYS